jgi:hypothetical protein
MTTTYNVRIWKTEQCHGQGGTTYKGVHSRVLLSWAVAGELVGCR